MTFRVGGWLLAVAFTALVIVQLLGLGSVHVPVAPVPMIGVVVGLVLWTLDSTRWARLLFGCAAVAAAARVLLALDAVDDRLGVLAFAGPAALAGGAMLRGAGKRLPWSLIPISLLLTIAAIVLVATHRGLPSLLSLDLLGIFVALDLLGAFPVIARIPHAAIPTLAGRLVTAIGFALVATGGWLAWVAIEETIRRSMPFHSMMLFGGVSLLAGVLALWRRRRGVSLPIVVAFVFGIACSLEVVPELLSRRFDEAVLTTRELPMARIALPSGDATVSAYRNAGTSAVTADHIGLDEVAVSWGFRADLAFTEADVMTKVDGVNVEVEVGVVGGQAANGSHLITLLAWTCGDTKLRASFGASGPLLRIQALATRIGHSIACVPVSPSTPAVSIPVSLPPTFRELAIPETHFRTFRDATNRIAFSIAWTMDDNYYETIQNNPEDMFPWFVRQHELDTITEPVQRTTLVIDGEYRWLGERTLRDRRLLVAVYYCRALAAYVAAGYDGPLSVPLASAIDLVRAPGCPE